MAPQLTRYPYLTDVVQTYATVNFATDRSNTTAKLKYGRVGQESCTAHSVTASKTAIVVGTASEYQWKAKLTGLSPNVKYCYRIFFGTTSIDLLGGDPSPQFWSALPAGSNQSYSFAVFGDWGDTDQQGNNPQQAALNASLGASGVRFALATGDTAYDSGSQLNYGDLNQTGFRVSSIFGPSFWPQAGDSVPLFSVPGNHGANATFFTNWPQGAGGRELEREVPDGDVLLCEQLQVGERAEHVVRVQRGERAVLRADRAMERFQRRQHHPVRDGLRVPLAAEQRRVPVAAERSADASVAAEVRDLALPAVRGQRDRALGHVPAGAEQPRGVARPPTA